MHELRKNPLLGSWVVLTPEIGQEPQEQAPAEAPCPYCPGNEAMTAPEVFAFREPHSSPDTPGWWVRIFPHPRPLLSPAAQIERRGVGMYDWISGVGHHEVLVETPAHGADLPDLPVSQIREILWAYKARLSTLREETRYRYLTVVKEHATGSGPQAQHAHSHIIGTPITPKLIKEEYAQCKEYYRRKERCLMCDIIYNELSLGERLVEQNGRFVAFCPYAPRFPFEIVVSAKRHCVEFERADSDDISSLARLLRRTLARVRLALGDVPYSWVLHNGPNRRSARSPEYWRTIEADYHWHLELVPDLYRGARMAAPWRPHDWPSSGFELGLDLPVSHIKPEQAARQLREVELAEETGA